MLTHGPEFTPGVSESCILSRVRSFVQTNPLYSEHGVGSDDDDRLLDGAVVDSRYLGEMISFIEDEFGVHVSKYEINEEDLGSLRAVARFVASKQPFAVG